MLTTPDSTSRSIGSVQLSILGTKERETRQDTSRKWTAPQRLLWGEFVRSPSLIPTQNPSKHAIPIPQDMVQIITCPDVDWWRKPHPHYVDNYQTGRETH
jgi:hypothetical protein